ncbi:MAG: HAMP domain-containing sensor histidine kinase [Bacilli bacterium]|nr:HAMP domain-containing sensor histidine kinase [Bacilli bacterium]
MKSNSLKVQIWKYLSIFSIFILSFLWLFQVLFLNKFYEFSKIKQLDNTINLIKESYNNNSLYSNVDNYAEDNGICIQIFTDKKIIYDSQSFNKGCMPKNVDYRDVFIKSSLDKETYKLINPRFNNEVLLKAIKLNSNTYAFLSSSLQPLDGAVEIIKKELVIVSIMVLLFSFLIGYFISKKLSKPIEKINKTAKIMAQGDYENAYFFIDENILELNELVATLNQTNDELTKIDELQKEILANVSHDLKTPLTMIKAYAEMVRDLTYKDDIKREDNLNVIIEETDRLNLLVNDIIELTKINNDLQNLNITEFDLVELINSIINRFSIMDANFVFENKLPIIVKADKIRIEQVIYNLIINAINYTGKDKKVIINLKENDKYVHVEIKDTGKGIDKEDLKLIWKRYYKVDKKYRREKKGSGIGLSIVENILKKHKFNYGVNSIKNKGTTFYFDIDKC